MNAGSFPGCPRGRSAVASRALANGYVNVALVMGCASGAVPRWSTRMRSGPTRTPPPPRLVALMTGEPVRRGLLDTSIMILRSRIAPEELPDEMAISAVTLAELSAGPHEVRPDTEQDVYFEAAERARRLDVLQRAEHEFDPVPFDADIARARGRVTAAVIASDRKTRRRAADLMIATT